MSCSETSLNKIRQTATTSQRRKPTYKIFCAMYVLGRRRRKQSSPVCAVKNLCALNTWGLTRMTMSSGLMSCWIQSADWRTGEVMSIMYEISELWCVDSSHLYKISNMQHLISYTTGCVSCTKLLWNWFATLTWHVCVCLASNQITKTTTVSLWRTAWEGKRYCMTNNTTHCWHS